jgi:hypothetical protein
VILKGKTQKGKNRIRELGSEWILLREMDRVLFNPEVGPWFFVRPANRKDGEKDRWIHASRDVDFEIAS